LAFLALPLVAASPACVRYHQETRLAVEALEKPRPAQKPRPSRLGLVGVRDGQVLRVQVFDEERCADVLLQRARATSVIRREPVRSSLLAAYVTGSALTLLGAAGITWALTHPPPEDSPLAAQNVYPSLGAVSVGGLLVLGMAVREQWRAGEQRIDLGERELEKLVRERPCVAGGGRTPRVAEALRLTLADGLQIEGTSDAQGQALLPLPADLDERLESTPRRAILEARSDPRAQVVIPL
jgi:hypothetical protein